MSSLRVNAVFSAPLKVNTTATAPQTSAPTTPTTPTTPGGGRLSAGNIFKNFFK